MVEKYCEEGLAGSAACRLVVQCGPGLGEMEKCPEIQIPKGLTEKGGGRRVAKRIKK